MFSNINHWHKVSAVTCLQRPSPVVLTHRFWLNISENISAAKMNSLFTSLPSCDNWEQTVQLWQAVWLWDGDVVEVHWRGNTVRLLFALEQDQASSVSQLSLCLCSGSGCKGNGTLRVGSGGTAVSPASASFACFFWTKTSDANWIWSRFC